MFYAAIPLIPLQLLGLPWKGRLLKNLKPLEMKHEGVEKESSSKSSLPQIPSGASEPDYPDGGWRAWSVVFGVWLMQFCTFGYANAYGVYNDYYVREYLGERYTSSQISWIGSVQLFLTLSGGLIAGRGFDLGYFYHLTIGGSVLFVFSLFMLSITHAGQYYQAFLTHGLGAGLAIGICYVPSMGVIAQYFQRRRAIAMGIATTGSAAGGALHPIMLNKLFHGPLGFHGGVRASAGLCLGLLIISLCLLRPRFQPKKSPISTLTVLKDFARDPSYVMMVIGTSVAYTGLYFPIFFLQLNAIKNGIEPNLAFYTIAILNATSILGRIFPTLIANHVGIINTVIPCIFITSVLVFCTLAIKGVAGTIIFAILYGFFAGTYSGLLSPVIGSLAKDNTEIGARLGICFTFTGIGALVGTPIAGALLTSSYIWWRPIIFSGMCVLTGALCTCISRHLLCRRKGTQWV